MCYFSLHCISTKRDAERTIVRILKKNNCNYFQLLFCYQCFGLGIPGRKYSFICFFSLCQILSCFPIHAISLKLAGSSLQQIFLMLKKVAKSSLELFSSIITHSGFIDYLPLNWNIYIRQVFVSQIVDHLQTTAYLLLVTYTKKHHFCSPAYDSDMQRHFNCCIPE